MSKLSEILYNKTVYLCSINNITQNQLADAIGVPRNTITNWYKSMPSLDKIIREAEYFDVSYDYLLGHCDDPKSHKKPNTFKPHTIRLIIASEQLDYSSEVEDASQKLITMLSALSNDKINS